MRSRPNFSGRRSRKRAPGAGPVGAGPVGAPVPSARSSSRSGALADGAPRPVPRFEDGDDREADHQHQHRHREIDRVQGDRLGVVPPEERLGGDHDPRAGRGGDRGGGRRHQRAAPRRCAADGDERQHHEAAADEPVGAHRQRPVADAVEQAERIVSAEGADEGEERDQTHERERLNGRRPAQFTKRERRFLQVANNPVAFAYRTVTRGTDLPPCPGTTRPRMGE